MIKQEFQKIQFFALTFSSQVKNFENILCDRISFLLAYLLISVKWLSLKKNHKKVFHSVPRMTYTYQIKFFNNIKMQYFASKK